jgi:hypothetical protein
MTEYKTTSRITVPAGTVVRLSPEQAADRARSLEKADDEGRFVTKDTLEFKAGEQLGIEGDLGRATMAKLEPVTGAEEVPSTSAAGDGSEPASTSRKPRGTRAAADAQ